MKLRRSIPPTSSHRGGVLSFVVLVLLVLSPCPGFGHQPGTSSLLLSTSPDGVLSGEVHLADVDLASLELMLRQRARSTELQRPSERAEGGIVPMLAKSLLWMRLMADDKPLALALGEPRPAETDGRVHTLIPFTADVAGYEKISVEYVGYFDFDPKHKVVTSLESGDDTKVGLLSYDSPLWEASLQAPGAMGQFVKFTWEGVWHIWIGIDHILFLLALLLPAVLHFQDGRWQPVHSFREASLNVLKVVTAFTVAHSVTLSLAALRLVTLPAKFVESVIALSVLLAALNNIWPVVRDRTWLVAFGFGLIHGFGFANVLADLALPAGTLAIALVSFNVGVELGQLAIVACFFPLAFSIRRRGFYQPVKLRFGSALISVIAIGWIVQRVFEVQVVPF